MASKFALPDDIIALFHDGQTLMCGGFANHGVPNRLIDCVIASGARHLTLISNDSGDADLTIGRLIHHGLVDKLIASHIGRNTETVALVAEGKIELELVPQGSPGGADALWRRGVGRRADAHRPRHAGGQR